MKIVNKKEFMKLKPPILFSNYRPYIIEGLYICGDNTSYGDNNFVHASLLDEVEPINGQTENWSSGDGIDLLHDAEKIHTEFGLDLECFGRECINDNSLYVVYGPNDIKKLVDRLNGVYEKIKQEE